MDHEGRESSGTPQALIDQQIQEEVRKEILIFCCDSLTLENEQIAADITIIGDAIDSHEFDNYTSIRFIVNVLTDESDKSQVPKFVNEVPETSRFYKNYREARALADALNFWAQRKAISYQDSMPEAFRILTERLGENLGPLEEGFGLLGTA